MSGFCIAQSQPMRIRSIKGSIEVPIIAALLVSPVLYGLFIHNRQSTTQQQQLIQKGLERYEEDLANYNLNIIEYRKQIFSRINSGREDFISVTFECANNAPDTETKRMCLDLADTYTQGAQNILNTPTIGY